MLERSRFAINRITCPALSIPDFFGLAHALGIEQVELRNDLEDGHVTDELTPHEVAESAEEHQVEVITINALQKFNLAELREQVIDGLEQLAATAVAMGCPAIVLCPNNDPKDFRPAAQKFKETVEALEALRPVLERHGLVGLVEPLGFVECSLRSAREALRALDAAGGDCFKLVHDTFHHHLGPDGPALLDEPAYADRVGLVHLSGVEAALPKEQLRDPHRVLPGGDDKLESRAQIQRLTAAGYAGPISFEPFATEVQELERDALERALARSIEAMS